MGAAKLRHASQGRVTPQKKDTVFIGDSEHGRG